MGQSLAERVASLPPDLRAEALKDLDASRLQFSAEFWLRPEQLPPPPPWNRWYIVSGRGFGKTRAGAEWVRRQAREYPGTRIALVARTAADVRDTMVQGPSGIIAVTPPSEQPLYEPSKRRLTWPNGSSAWLHTSDAPDSLRGPAFEFSWADEVATWSYLPDASGLTAWENLVLATREGDTPQIVATTTPRRTPFVKDLIAAETDPMVIVTRGSTMDNAANLPDSYLSSIVGKYAGTHLAQQELEGILLEAVEGALLTQEIIDANRTLDAPPLPLIVVAVDPSVAERPRDEAGIVVVGATAERELHRRHAYVLEDASLLGSPDAWTRAVVQAAHKWHTPLVVCEQNQGGQLVTNAIRAIDPHLKVVGVHARQGKMTRAEPVALAAEQGRVHHVGWFPDLESEWTGWEPGQSLSPGRLDASTWGITALLIRPPEGLNWGRLRAHSPAAARLPSTRSAASVLPFRRRNR